MISLLIDAIKNRLESEVCKHLQIPKPPDDGIGTEIELVTPTIFKGYLPPKSAPKPDEPPEFPHIIIRPTEGGMQPEQDTVQVKFLLGGFGEDSTGYEWLMGVLDAISRNFQERPIFEMTYEFQNDFHWKLFDDQPFPYWVVQVVGSWSVIKPQNIQFQDEL